MRDFIFQYHAYIVGYVAVIAAITIIYLHSKVRELNADCNALIEQAEHVARCCQTLLNDHKILVDAINRLEAEETVVSGIKEMHRSVRSATANSNSRDSNGSTIETGNDTNVI